RPGDASPRNLHWYESCVSSPETFGTTEEVPMKKLSWIAAWSLVLAPAVIGVTATRARSADTDVTVKHEESVHEEPGAIPERSTETQRQSSRTTTESHPMSDDQHVESHSKSKEKIERGDGSTSETRREHSESHSTDSD